MPKTTKLENKILSAVGKAIHEFNMIEHHDRVLACLSGGKDSWTMLDMLLKLKQKAPVKFEVIAMNIDPNFKNYENNKIADYCQKNNIELHIIKTKIKDIIEEKKRANSSFCSFCARLRRGSIYTAAKKLKINKIALGHHADDLIETLMMNLFFSGQIKSMAPIMRTDDKKHIVIRPLIYVYESDIKEYAADKFPIIPANCPLSNCNDQQRAKTKKLIAELAKDIPYLKSTLLNSLHKVVKSHLLDRKLFDFDF